MALGFPNRRLERHLSTSGYLTVAGLDEVGRGPAAGPVTVAAVILPDRCRLSGLTDSKLLSPEQRAELAYRIQRQAVSIGIGWSSHRYIDEFGLTAALSRAGQAAVGQLHTQPDAIIMDGIHNYLRLDRHTYCMAKADQKSLCVAAASVIAKVARDRYMEHLDRLHSGYGLAQHKGYLTAEHLAAIRRYGPSPVHRLRWKTFQMQDVGN